MAQVRKTREDKQQSSKPTGNTEQKGKKAQATSDSASEKETDQSTRPQTRWYMGQYGQTDGKKATYSTLFVLVKGN